MSSKSGIGLWSRNKTFKLIESIERHPGLWNCTMEFRDRDKKTKVMKEIAASLEVDEAEMNRKWHNLRCQMNAEIRKKKKKIHNGENNVTWQSSWEYFDALLFVVKDQEISSNVEDQQCQEFKLTKRVKLEPVDEDESKSSTNVIYEKREEIRSKQLDEDRSRKRAVTSEKSQIYYTHEEQESSNKLVDDCAIFGEFVAAELRQLRSHERRRKLKRVIQKAIIATGEEEDLEIDVQPSTTCKRCSSFNFVSVDEVSNASSENVENSDNYITLANFYENVDGYK